MVTKAFLAAQVRRLSVLTGHPTELPAWQEYGRIAERHAKSEGQVSRVIDGFVTDPERRFCPSPGELRAALIAEPEERPALHSARRDCPVCGGTGWRLVERGGVSGVEICQCRRMPTGVTT